MSLPEIQKEQIPLGSMFGGGGGGGGGVCRTAPTTPGLLTM